MACYKPGWKAKSEDSSAFGDGKMNESGVKVPLKSRRWIVSQQSERRWSGNAIKIAKYDFKGTFLLFCVCVNAPLTMF